MENKQGKKPAEWFKMLKEPYRSEAIEAIDKNFSLYEEYPESLKMALNNSIRPATNEEVLKYFPDEKFEPIELRPEELVSGEVYIYINIADEKSILQFNGQIEEEEVYYHVKINDRGVKKHKDWVSTFGKFYHATPQEKALLLGDEQKDWKAKFEELKVENDSLKVMYRLQIEKKAKLEAYNDELTEKINELQKNNQETVYFYMNTIGSLMCTSNKEDALSNSEEDEPIYEAVKIGVKKSVLVNEKA